MERKKWEGKGREIEKEGISMSEYYRGRKSREIPRKQKSFDMEELPRHIKKKSAEWSKMGEKIGRR